MLLLAVALASGGLAASRVHERERRVEDALGPSVDVLVAARDLPPGTRVLRAALAVRRVPARFVPPGALGSAAGVLGARTAAPVPAGGYLTTSVFERGAEADRGGALRRGERAVTVEVAGGSATGDLAAGARVDVLVSTETGASGGRTTMTLAGAELLRLGEAGGYSPDPAEDRAAGASTGPTALATLRVSVRQAIYLTAADNFGREIRLLLRPPGDHAPAGATVSQSQL